MGLFKEWRFWLTGMDRLGDKSRENIGLQVERMFLHGGGRQTALRIQSQSQGS